MIDHLYFLFIPLLFFVFLVSFHCFCPIISLRVDLEALDNQQNIFVAPGQFFYNNNKFVIQTLSLVCASFRTISFEF